jgi:hypothetical protein
MAHAVQPGTSREAEASSKEFGRRPYSRGSFERVAHVVGALAVADHQDIADVLIDAAEVPQEAEPRRRPAGRLRKDAPKKPVARNFRMAYCGTVTLHDENGVGGIPFATDACPKEMSSGCATAWLPMWRRCGASGRI